MSCPKLQQNSAATFPPTLDPVGKDTKAASESLGTAQSLTMVSSSRLIFGGADPSLFRSQTHMLVMRPSSECTFNKAYVVISFDWLAVLHL